MYIGMMILGIACVLYCLAVLLFAGYGTKFFLIWGVMGICFLLWGIFGREIWHHFPLWLKRVGGTCTVIGLLFFATIEGMVLSGFGAKGEPELDYIIVLGAQLKNGGPSYVLQKRLDQALVYLQENPDTKVIVSGGQGKDEPDTEAQGMYDYLTARGISPERILLEDQSRNTSQNIRFSSRYFDKETDRIGIVTNNFHIFRALRLAEGVGYQSVCGIAAGSHPGLLLNNMLREFFGVVKDFLVGNF